ncbi:MarR family winged helix-turn-helix transcriptional regulator [Streptacidiphilus sp. PAMC 29251]
MPMIVPAPLPAEVAQAASVVVELLDALQGRGQESAPQGRVSPSQLRALLAIERWEGLNLRALGEALASKPPAVSRLCDRLQADGLLERSLSSSSRREVELRLSRRGHAVLAEYRSSRVQELREVLGTMSATGLSDLTRGMAAFRDAVLARHDTDAHGSQSAHSTPGARTA